MSGLAPSPPAYPVVGHLPAFLRDKLGFLLGCAETYGDVVRLQIGGPTFLLNNPEDIRHVLSTNHANYEKSPRIVGLQGKRVFGDGLITSSSEAHAAKRQAVQPIFHRRFLPVFADDIVAQTEAALQRWQDGAVLDVASEMMALVQRITLKTLFGVEGGKQARLLAEALTARRRYLEYLFRSLLPFPEYLPAPVTLRYRRAARYLDLLIREKIREARSSSRPGATWLALLVQRARLEGRPLSDQQIRDEVLTLGLASYETLGESLAWTWSLLAQHPEERALLEEGLGTVLGGRAPRFADLPRLSQAEMVWAESLRLFPPTWLFVRVATKADRLPSGVLVPAGAKIYLCQYVAHRNPRYFPEPDAFRPARFDKGKPRSWPSYAYFPFGGGPRTCIGLAWAKTEALLIVATIARQYRLDFVPGQTIVPEPDMTLRPRDGLRMRLAKR